MIVLDANILIYAYDTATPFYKAASAWVEKIFSSTELIGIPLQTVGAFLRLITDSRLPGDRMSMAEAVEVVDHWFAQPNIKFLAPDENHWLRLRQMLLEGQVRGPLVTDAQLAALTMEYGGVLHTCDRDFARFPGLRWKNPLV